MKRIYYVFLLAALLATGCENMRQEVEPAGLGQVAKKLVIIGFISPQDTIIAVKINCTRPVMDANYTTNYGVVKNAIVTLASGSQSIQLTYNGKFDYYQADPKKFPLRAGEKYQITARTPEGLSASGNCIIPQPARLQRVRLDSVGSGNEPRQYFVRYYWQDSPQVNDYYQTTGVFTFAKFCATCKTEAGTKPKSETAAVLFESPGQLTSLMTDRAQDGKLLESFRGYLNPSATTQEGAAKSTFSNAYDRAIVKGTVLHVDEAYFNYHQALALQKKSDGNPFAEPVLLPNTIDGGLGCFAGYNQSSLTVTFK